MFQVERKNKCDMIYVAIAHISAVTNKHKWFIFLGKLYNKCSDPFAFFCLPQYENPYTCTGATTSPREYYITKWNHFTLIRKMRNTDSTVLSSKNPSPHPLQYAPTSVNYRPVSYCCPYSSPDTFSGLQHLQEPL